MKRNKEIGRRPGRPLSFDREKALDRAMLQFWRTGYETTSVAELTKAMGITAPSLYLVFGDKERLFLDSLKRYTNAGGEQSSAMIEKSPSAKAAARTLLETAAHWFTQSGNPAGCLIASSASTGSHASLRVRRALKKIRVEIQDTLSQKAQADIATGMLPKSANAQALSAMTVAMIQGMSTLARDGASRKELLDVVESTMASWPGR